MNVVTITDLDELHETLFNGVLRKFGNWPINAETQWRAEAHAKKLMKKWVEKNCTRVMGNRSDLWEMRVDVNGSLFIYVFRRYSVSIVLDQSGLELVPVFGNFLFE